MPQITKLSQQVKNADRINIFIDDKYSFSLNHQQIIEFGLKVKQQLKYSDVRTLKQKSYDGKLQDAVLRKLARRKHSEYEIVSYMRQKKADTELIDSTIEYLREKQLLDDKQFAEIWIAERRRTKQRSNSKLKAELLQKSVDKDIIDELLEDSFEQQTNALIELINKKKHISRYQDEKKLITYLQRNGYRYYDIKEALNLLED